MIFFQLAKQPRIPRLLPLFWLCQIMKVIENVIDS